MCTVPDVTIQTRIISSPFYIQEALISRTDLQYHRPDTVQGEDTNDPAHIPRKYETLVQCWFHAGEAS